MKYVLILLLFISCLENHASAQAVVGGLGAPLTRDQARQPSENRSGTGATQGRGGRPLGLESLPLAELPRGVRESSAGTFVVTSSRPLEVAAQLLTRKLGVPVAFEEAAWLSPRDSALVTQSSTVMVTIPPIVQNKSNVIQAALDSYRMNRNPGEFKLVRFGDDGLSIVADVAEDERGTVVKQINPLDLRISFSEEDRTISDTITLIYSAINKASAPRRISIVTVGQMPSSFRTERVRLGASDEVAREVLIKALRSSRQANRQIWSLRFDPLTKIYGMWFQPAEEEVTVPGHGTVLRYISWPQ